MSGKGTNGKDGAARVALAPGRARNITEADATVYDPPLRAVWCGGTGNLVVETIYGDTVTYTAVPAGTMIWIDAKRVLEASTVTNLVGHFDSTK